MHLPGSSIWRNVKARLRDGLVPPQAQPAAAWSRSCDRAPSINRQSALAASSLRPLAWPYYGLNAGEEYLLSILEKYHNTKKNIGLTILFSVARSAPTVTCVTLGLRGLRWAQPAVRVGAD